MRNKRNTIRLNESQLHNMISESVKQVLKEITTTSNGVKYEPNIDYFPGKGRFRDYDEDYWGNWEEEPSELEYDIYSIPKSARAVAQKCEKILQRYLNVKTHSNSYMQGENLNIDLTCDYECENGFWKEPIFKKIKKSIEKILKPFSNENKVWCNISFDEINIIIPEFKVDKNGYESTEFNKLKFYNNTYSQHINRNGTPYSEREI